MTNAKKMTCQKRQASKSIQDGRAAHIADSAPHNPFCAPGGIDVPVPSTIHGQVVWIHDLQAVHWEDVQGPLIPQVLQCTQQVNS